MSSNTNIFLEMNQQQKDKNTHKKTNTFGLREKQCLFFNAHLLPIDLRLKNNIFF